MHYSIGYKSTTERVSMPLFTSVYHNKCPWADSFFRLSFNDSPLWVPSLQLYGFLSRFCPSDFVFISHSSNCSIVLLNQIHLYASNSFPKVFPVTLHLIHSPPKRLLFSVFKLFLMRREKKIYKWLFIENTHLMIILILISGQNAKIGG